MLKKIKPPYAVTSLHEKAQVMSEIKYAKLSKYLLLIYVGLKPLSQLIGIH